jgi:hypothetical protein
MQYNIGKVLSRATTLNLILYEEVMGLQNNGIHNLAISRFPPGVPKNLAISI